TKNAGLQDALDWLEKFGENMPPEDKKDVEDSETRDTNDALETQPESVAAQVSIFTSCLHPGSLKCADCGKFFKNQALASYHGEKSGHTNFEESTEEIKPLTEQERQERLEELRLKMESKRAAKAKVDAEEAKANEAIRRKAGKDMLEYKRELEAKEVQKNIALRNKEKQEEAKAKARVKAQIEEDKKRRAEKAALEKSKRDGVPLPQTSNVTNVVKKTPTSVPSSGSSKVYTEGKFNLRLVDRSNESVILTLRAEQNLFDLADLLIDHQSNLGYIFQKGSIKFSTSYPRKTYNKEEMAKSIKELGLLPSISLIVNTDYY
ncbi:hypothetical protein BY996DRAFT_4587403, partial [Phakopsora pachyrhizi]